MIYCTLWPSRTYPTMQDWFNNQKSNSEIQHISKIKKKIYMILSIDGAKFKYIHDRKKKKTYQQARGWKELLQSNKDHWQKTITHVTLNYETLNSFLLLSGVRQRQLLSPLLLNIMLEVLNSSEGKEINDTEFGKEKIKLLFADYMLCTYKTLWNL